MLRRIPLLILAILLAACPSDVEDEGREEPEPRSCGDGRCDNGETSASCAADCAYCGDGACNRGERPATCPADCVATEGCGDGLCNNGETSTSCPGDCPRPPGTVLGRFARWCGKVNSHTSAEGGWLTDSDCSSGCDIGGLAYCQKFWPDSTDIRQVTVSPKPASNVWASAFCEPVVDDHDGDDEFECVDTSVCGDGVCSGDETSAGCPGDCGSTPGTVLGRFAHWCGKVNTHQSTGGNWQTDSDCSSGCDVGGLTYCQKFWPAASTIRQVPVSSKPATHVWTNGGCGPVVDEHDGDDEFECVD
ncbi:hypothetical protein ACLESD_00090 [Pyxidicoccus sp. 3LFB2]